jgi:hypothetical protein
MQSRSWWAFMACFLATRLFASDPGADMADAATRFLAALSDEQRAKTAFAWTNDERLNWQFVPVDRKGIQLRELSVAQQHLAQGLLGTALSHRGHLKATTIMSLEQVLQDMEGPKRRFPRDPGIYHVSIFGSPGPHGAWGWRFEGHHLSINLTLSEGKVVSGTPNFMGTNPAEVRVDPKAPDDILTSNARKAQLGDPRGITLGDMPEEARSKALHLLREYVGRLRDDVAAAEMAKIEKAGISSIRFAWAGSVAKGQRHYYRLVGPTFLLEYDNTQNDANHVHAVWRNPDNDFGLDVLADHLRAAHGK